MKNLEIDPPYTRWESMLDHVKACAALLIGMMILAVFFLIDEKLD